MNEARHEDRCIKTLELEKRIMSEKLAAEVAEQAAEDERKRYLAGVENDIAEARNKGKKVYLVLDYNLI